MEEIYPHIIYSNKDFDIKKILIKIILISYKILKFSAEISTEKSINNIHYFNRLTNRVVFSYLSQIPNSESYLTKEFYLDYIFYISNIIVKYRIKAFKNSLKCKFIYLIFIYTIIQIIIFVGIIKNVIKILFKNHIELNNKIIFFSAPKNSLIITTFNSNISYLTIGDYFYKNYPNQELKEIEKLRHYSIKFFNITKFLVSFNKFFVIYKGSKEFNCYYLYHYLMIFYSLSNEDIYKSLDKNVLVFNLASSVVHGLYRYDKQSYEKFNEISYSQNWTAWPTKYLNNPELQVESINPKFALMEYSVDCYVGWGMAAGFTNIYDNSKKIKLALNKAYRWDLPIVENIYFEQPILLGFNPKNKVKISNDSFNIMIYDVFPSSYRDSLSGSFTGVAGYDFDFCMKFYLDILSFTKHNNVKIFTKLKYGKHRYNDKMITFLSELSKKGELTLLDSDVNLEDSYRNIDLVICMPYVSMKIFYEHMHIKSIYYSPNNFVYLTDKSSINLIIVGLDQLSEYMNNSLLN